MKRGAKVFRNLAPTGDTDMVLVKDEKIIRIDVKHLKYDSRWNGTYCANSHTAPPPNVTFVYVNPITGQIRWRMTKGKKCCAPEGWEDFWD